MELQRPTGKKARSCKSRTDDAVDFATQINKLWD
jgi:hypothetical protein